MADLSKTNAYAVLNTTGPAASKINAYAVLRAIVPLAARLTATSRASAGGALGVLNLAGQIAAASRATLFLPTTISLGGLIIAQTTARYVYTVPPPNSRVVTGQIRATSSAGSFATIAAVRIRQNDVSIITG
jgi:hypothetical protein